MLSRQSDTSKNKMIGPVQRFAGSEYFSFDKILQRTSFKPLPEQQTRRLRTRRARTVVNNNITASSSKSKMDLKDTDASMVKIEDPVKTDMRMYRMHLNWNQLYEKEKYLWDTEHIGQESMEEAKRVFSSLDENDRGVIPRRLLRKLVPEFENDKNESEQHSNDKNDTTMDDEMIRFDEFLRFYFDLLNAKPSTSLDVDFDTETRGMMAYYRTHLNAFVRNPRNTKEMREAQRETNSARAFEMGEFKGKLRDRRVLSSLFNDVIG